MLEAILYLNLKKIWGFAGVLADDVFQLFKLGSYVIPMTDSIVYLNVTFKF